jgi:hypothetical protein
VPERNDHVGGMAVVATMARMSHRFVAGLLFVSSIAVAQPVQRAPTNIKANKLAVMPATPTIAGSVHVVTPDSLVDGRSKITMPDSRHVFVTRVATKGPTHVNVTQPQPRTDGSRDTMLVGGVAKGDTFHVVAVPSVNGKGAVSTFWVKTSIVKGAPHIAYINNEGWSRAAAPDDLVFVAPIHTNKSFLSPVGTWWDEGQKKWAVINEAQSAIPSDTQFQALLVAKDDPNAFVFTVSSKNPDGPARLPIAKAGRNDTLLVTHRATPGQILARPFSIAQEPDTGQWQIVTDKPLVDGTQFNVLVVRGKTR